MYRAESFSNPRSSQSGEPNPTQKPRNMAAPGGFLMSTFSPWGCALTTGAGIPEGPLVGNSFKAASTKDSTKTGDTTWPSRPYLHPGRRLAGLFPGVFVLMIFRVTVERRSPAASRTAYYGPDDLRKDGHATRIRLIARHTYCMDGSTKRRHRFKAKEIGPSFLVLGRGVCPSSVQELGEGFRSPCPTGRETGRGSPPGHDAASAADAGMGTNLRKPYCRCPLSTFESGQGQLFSSLNRRSEPHDTR